MSTSYFSMWAMLILMAFGAFGGLVIHGNLLGSIREAFPASTIKQEALQRCGRMDAQFSRFFAQDRETCYRAVLGASPQAASNAAGEW